MPSFSIADELAPAQNNEIVEVRSLVVVPFVSFGCDEHSDFFADGLTEEIINQFSAVPTLRVVARRSAFQFKNQAQDVREIGAQLNAETVLEGSVRRIGNQLRITAQLIDAATGFHLAAAICMQDATDIFAAQDNVAQKLIAKLTPQALVPQAGLPILTFGK